MRVLLAMVLSATLACASGGDEDPGALAADGSTSDSTLGYNDGESPFDDTGSSFGLDTAPAAEISADAFWADDPPPKMCGDSGVMPVVPGGTPECPDDKNREGCACLKEGATAPCWPGFRKNRNRGICKDGTTTCRKKDETNLTWGPCEGYVLPSGTTGKEACTCFSGGTWKIANLSPCFYKDASMKIIGAVSTVPTYDASGNVTAVNCPPTFDKPAGNWSKTTLNVDCAGHFTLCFTIKAGDAAAPKDTDCVVTKQCTTGDYTTPGKVQPFGDLPSWINKDPTCSAQFNATGGYGEMSVDGTSVECDAVKKVFGRVPYCPSKCNEAAFKDTPECKACSSGGGGSF